MRSRSRCMYFKLLTFWCAIIAVVSQQTTLPELNSLVIKSSNAKIFGALWSKAGSTFLNTVTLNDGIPYTVFVPIDSAFAKLSTDQMAYINSLTGTSLANFLNYHCLPQVTASLLQLNLGYKLSDLANYGQQNGNLLNYRKFSTNFLPPSASVSGLSTVSVFNSPYNVVYVNNALIVQADVMAQAGVVHYIDNVLFYQDPTVIAISWLTIQIAPQPGIWQYTTGCPTNLCSPQFAQFLSNTATNPLTTVTLAYDWLWNALAGVTSAVTVFVPSTDALNAIPTSKLNALIANKDLLAQVVLAHVFSGRVLYTNPLMNATTSPISVTSVSLSCGPSDASVTNPVYRSWVQPCSVFYPGALLDPSQLRVQVGRTSAQIVQANIPVLNGVAHVIDRLLGYVYLNCFELLATNGNFSQFYAAVAADSLINQLIASGTVTVFVPTNAAFSAALYAAGGSLNTTMMRSVLQMHVVNGYVRTVAAIGNSVNSDTNAYGTTVRYIQSVDATRVETGFGNGFISGRIVVPDLACTNGIAHAVDTVYGVPTLTVQQFVDLRPDLSQTAARLIEAGQTFLNNKSSSQYTLFAPNNLAWQYLSKIAPNVDLSNVLRINIMRRHVLAGRVQLMNKISLATVFNTPYGLITIKQVSTTWQVIYSRTVANVVINDYLCQNGLVHVLDNVLYAVEDNYMTAASCVDPAHCGSNAVKFNFILLALSAAAVLQLAVLRR